MIVKNEESSLDDCLKNAKLYADEIIIVDTGSSDKTKEIAKKYTDKIYDFVWCDDFAKARNYSFELANSEYIMWLDGDDILLEDSALEIKKWKESGEECDVLMCRYVASFDENFTPTFEYYRERIVKNSPTLRWKDRVHEAITPSGVVRRNEKIAIYHNKRRANPSERNLNIYRDMKKKGESFSPRNQFYFARELYFNGYISQAIDEFERFLAEDNGWIENKIEAHLNLSKCYQLQNENYKALDSLFLSFILDLPRSEIVYEIGNVFVSLKKYNMAIYWLKLALSSNGAIEKGGFVNKECSTFLPALQLCYCYSKLGDDITAYYYHKICQKFKPNDEKVKYNEMYFNDLFKKEHP